MISVGATVCGRQVSGPSSNSMHDNMSYSARVRGMDTETDGGSHSNSMSYSGRGKEAETVSGRQVSGPSSNSMHDSMSYSARVRGMDTETDGGSHISKGFPPYFERKKSSLTALTAA